MRKVNIESSTYICYNASTFVWFKYTWNGIDSASRYTKGYIYIVMAYINGNGG